MLLKCQGSDEFTYTDLKQAERSLFKLDASFISCVGVEETTGRSSKIFLGCPARDLTPVTEGQTESGEKTRPLGE